MASYSNRVLRLLSIRYLRVFPFLAGFFWAVTLLSMLIYWLAIGQPTYPVKGRVHVPMISDVAAFKMKPLFITGATISGFFFVCSVVSVHYVRYDHRMHGFEDRDKAHVRSRVFSALSVVLVFIAGCCLLLLSVLDTYRYHEAHHALLFALMLSTVIGAACLSVVYFEQMKPTAKDRLLRLSSIAGNLVFVAEFLMGIAFITLVMLDRQRPAVFLEWTMGLVMTFYLWSMMGIVGPVRMEKGLEPSKSPERSPLLGRSGEAGEVQ